MSEYSGDAARWSVWCGQPILLIGNKKELDALFDGFDDRDRELIGDHRYFWLLTEDDTYSHPVLEADRRAIVLSWTHSEQNVVYEALSLLCRFPRLRGLGKRMHLLRQEIVRISSARTGPGYSVLVLGDSGVGKEEFAQSLFENSDRAHSRLHAISGAWMNMESGMALSELVGIPSGIAPGVRGHPGLLEIASDHAIFFDDFEAAPVNIQEILLRVMGTERGRVASYRQIGNPVEMKTSAWFIFATNRGVDGLIRDQKLREDVLYRFEDRVLVIPPLRVRPADLPAISVVVWEGLWKHSPDRAVPLPLPVIKQMANANLKWEGNIRTLRALLGLVVSMRCSPVHNQTAVSQLIEKILSRGRTYKDWLGIYEQDYFYTGSSGVELVRRDDAKYDCEGPSRAGQPDESALVPSERRTKAALTPEGWAIFRSLVEQAPPTKSSDRVRVSVRMARIVTYVAAHGSITWQVAAELSAVRENTAIKDLLALAGYRIDIKNPRLREKKAGGASLLVEAGSGKFTKGYEYFR